MAILSTLDNVPVEEAGEAVESYLAAQTSDARSWPRNGEMTRTIPGIKMYGNVRQARLRVVLEAVEMKLRTEKHEATGLPATLELEHAMPNVGNSTGTRILRSVRKPPQSGTEPSILSAT
jgi:hypothetical protein